MALPILTNIDLNKNQLLNALLQIISGDHGTPVEGLIWYDSAAQAIKFRDSSTIRTLGVAGGGGNADTLDSQDGTYYLARANHTGTQSADTLTDGTTNHVFTAADDTKLAGIATGATANSADATLLARANHTGTQLASTISNFDTQVRTSRLDQMATPTAAVAMGAQKITGLADGTVSTDAATYGQLSAAIQGFEWKTPVRAAATTNLTLSGTQTIDGVACVAGDRVGAFGQTTASASGIYIVAAGAWARAADMDTAAEANNATVMVEEGTVNKGDVYTQTATIATIGTTSMVWTKVSEGNQTYTADGTSLELTGSQFSVTDAGVTAAKLAAAVAGNGLTGGAGSALAVGAGTGIVSNANDVAIDTAVVARKYSANVGDGSATSIAVTHSLGTRAVHVTVFRNSTPWDTVLCDVERTDTNTVTVKFAVAPTSAQYTVVVVG